MSCSCLSRRAPSCCKSALINHTHTVSKYQRLTLSLGPCTWTLYVHRPEAACHDKPDKLKTDQNFLGWVHFFLRLSSTARSKPSCKPLLSVSLTFN